MQCWSNAGSFEKKLFYLISKLFDDNQVLIQFLFNPTSAKLRLPADELIFKAAGFCSSDIILIKIAIDLWCEQGHISVTDLFCLEKTELKRVLLIFAELAGLSTHGEGLFFVD